jgi:hypothetical protein
MLGPAVRAAAVRSAVRSASTGARFPALDTFSRRHIGPQPKDEAEMLKAIGVSSLDELVRRAIPEDVLMAKAPALAPPLSEAEVGARFREIANMNKVREKKKEKEQGKREGGKKGGKKRKGSNLF